MDSFDFDSLSQDAREQTLAFFKPNPEPEPVGDEFTSYRAMMGDALEEKDWLEEMQEELTGEEMAGLCLSNLDKNKPNNASHDMLADGGNATSEILISKAKKLSCTWNGCEESFSQPELAAHLSTHGICAAQLFHAPSLCVWSGCLSKATFKKLTAYKNHLKNIHVEPLICRVAKCTHRKPFRDQDDLDRHSSTSHSDVKKYHCPYDTCDAVVNTFARKDKWLKHIRETVHANDTFCPYHHCAAAQTSTPRGFENRKQISEHFSKYHARNERESYECALGSCAKAMTPNYWCRDGVIKHLRADHGMFYSILLVHHLTGERRIISAKDVHEHNAKKPWAKIDWEDCEICSTEFAQAGTQASRPAVLDYQPLPVSQMNGFTRAQIS